MDWPNVIGLICNILSLLILIHNFYRYTIEEIKRDKHELDDRELLEQNHNQINKLILINEQIHKKVFEPPPSPTYSNSS